MGLIDRQLPMRLSTRRGVVNLVERFIRRSATSQGPGGRLEVALTFDDGPHPEWTPKVLDALDRAQAKATFFVLGRNVAAHREIVVEARRRGHEIGTHLFSHRRDTVLDDARFNDELKRSKELLESLLGEPLTWLRFPYGAPGKQRPRLIRDKFGVQTVHWSFSSHDARLKDATDILKRVEAGLRPGAIVLLHDALSDEGPLPEGYVLGRAATVEALAGIGALLTARALRAVTLTELLRCTDRA